MKNYLWKINEEKLSKTNLKSYSDFVKKNYKINSNNDFYKLWLWSVEQPQLFWKSVWDFTKVKGKLGNILIKESDIFFKNKFFPDSKLNYAENILKKNTNELAIIFKSENGYKTVLSWKDLNLNVVFYYLHNFSSLLISRQFQGVGWEIDTIISIILFYLARIVETIIHHNPCIKKAA